MVLIRDVVAPQEGLVYKSDQIKLKINKIEIGIGTLYISEDHLSWKPADKSEGIFIMWKQIGLHGISNIPVKSVYFVVEQTIVWDGVYDQRANGGANGNAAMDDDANADDSDNDEGHESDCEDDLTELWLIPLESSAVDPIFQAMKECQTLHPDSAESVSDESDFMDAVEEQHEERLYDDEVGQGDMRNLNLNEERFADAEDE